MIKSKHAHNRGEMDPGDWTYVTLNSSQIGQPLNTAAAFGNVLARSVGATSKRLQVALFDFTYELKNTIDDGTYLVFMDVVVPNQIIGGELTSLLRTVRCTTPGDAMTSIHKGTYEPNNLQWVDAMGTGGSVNFVTTVIMDSTPTGSPPTWNTTSDLVGTTIITLAFRSVD